MASKFDLSKFTKPARKHLERAQTLAQKLNHQHVEIEHVGLAMLEEDEGLATATLQKLGLDTKSLGRGLIDELELLPKAYKRSDSVFVGKKLLEVLQEASAEAGRSGDHYANSDHVLIAAVLLGGSYFATQLKKGGATAEKLRESLTQSRGGKPITTAEGPTSEILSKYATDLTKLAAEGRLEPVIGRDAELRRIMQVLSRKSKNNPVLIGEPGVGKTAIVEALAQRMHADDVPLGLKGKVIMSLDLGSLVAGTSLRGQFEERIKAIVNEIVASKGKIILFIDELHQIMGAGGGDGPMNASNLLKPALARGELSLIGTTTVDEYRQYIEPDAAFERRFQTITVEELSVEQCVSVLRGIKQRYEIHHNVQILDSALVAAAQMTDRYITDRALPDKAIDAIDEAASRLRLEIDSKPTELDEMERRIHNMGVELGALVDQTDADSVASRKKFENDIESLEEEAAGLRARWQLEKNDLDAVTGIKGELAAAQKEVEEATRKGEIGRAAELKYSVIPKIEKEIERLNEASSVSKGKRLLKDYCDENEIAEVIASWTGIPVSKMMESEREKLLNMPDRLRQRVVGQEHAIELICAAIWRSRAGLQDRNRPIGNFMFVGPTGVGKTELAKALSEFLFDSEDALVRIDMSEYMEQSKVNTLIGSARGYVGSEQGGILTEAVRHNPYSVVLFDEAEKAHPDVFNILLQVMDEGRLSDSQGRRIDFTNTLVILTSNVGSRKILDLAGKVSGEEMTTEVKEILKDHFRPEFLNRLDAPVVFSSLDKDAIRLIVDIQVKKLRKLLAEQKMTIDLTDNAKEFLVTEGYEPEYGARPLKRAIGTFIQDPLAVEVLESKFVEGDHIIADVADTMDRLVFSKGKS